MRAQVGDNFTSLAGAHIKLLIKSHVPIVRAMIRDENGLVDQLLVFGAGIKLFGRRLKEFQLGGLT